MADAKKKRSVKPKLSEKEKKILELKQKLIKVNKDEDSIHVGLQRSRPLSYISTGDPELDRIIAPQHFEKNGFGGVPRGFLCEFYGPTGGGKSSLCMDLAANVTKNGGFTLWVDAESSFVDEWAQTRGIGEDSLVRSDTGKTAEAYMDEVLFAAESGDYDLIVIDSLTALQPECVMETDLTGDPRIGAQARLMTRVCPKLVAAAKKGNTTIVFINQIRYKIGVKYGNPETTPGGEALKFFSSLRLRLAQLSASGGRGIEKDGEEIGIRSNVQITKSRFGPPFRETVIAFYYGEEKPEPLDMLLDMALSSKIIRTRTRSNTQHFTLHPPESPTQDKRVYQRLKGIAGFDEFKRELLETDGMVLEIGKRLVEEKKKALPNDVVHYLKQCEDNTVFG